MKRINVVLLLVVMIFAFAVPVFAQTTIEEVRAKMENAKNSGVRTLEQVQAELKRAGDERQLAVITGIIHNYGVLYKKEFTAADLHEVKLPKGKTVSHIATGLITGGSKNIKNILMANGISPEQAEKLGAGTKLYVLTRMISKDFILDPYEAKLLKEQIAAAKKAVDRLTGEVGVLKETVVLQKDEITGLEKALAKEQIAHAETKEILTETTKVLKETKEVLSVKTTEVQEYKGLYGGLQIMTVVMTVVFLIILAVLIYNLYFREARGEKKIAATKKVMEESREAEGCSATRRTTGRTVSTVEEKSKNSSLESSLLAV